ncbi:MAG: carboxypeptidase regulatory-like domain-containing protein [Pyrinomonadaceae bacterium]
MKVGAIMTVLSFLLLIFAFPAAAQKTSGQITGTVTDPSGAAVPDVVVIATQSSIGLQRTTTSSSDGNYTFPDLPIGTYQVSASHAGFSKVLVENVVVNVSSVTRQDLTLKIGAVEQQVTITADALQVQTETAALGEVVNGQQVRELPLNGRSFVQLTQLQPGVSAANNFDSKNKGLFSGVDFSVNGNSAQSNLFLTDGANNNDTGSNRTILIYPSIEAIAEFKMLRNSYGPEYGQAAGSIISIVTRGGENKFHGSLFYFGRNDALNATEFFAKRGGNGKDKLRRNDYGFSLGGPLPFPNFGEGGPLFKPSRDRLFFFFSEEFNKELRGQTRSGNVPTLAERSGDFSDPARRNCNGGLIGNGRPGSTNQIIPQSALSPAGLLLVQLYPLPNRTSTAGDCTNWAESLNSPINFREENVRIDANITKSNHIFGRYTQDHWTNAAPILLTAGLWGDDPFPSVESSWAQPARQAAIKLTSTLSTTAVNEVQFSYSANRIHVTPGTGGTLNAQINQAIPGYFSDSIKVNGVNRPHALFWSGIPPFTSTRGPALQIEAPFNNSLDIYSIRDDFSKVSGNHTFKMGFLFDKAGKNEDSCPQCETPQFWGPQTWGSNNSGNTLADILTKGSLFGYNESDKEAVAHTRYTNLEFYFGDTWKVKPNITLELGARYSIFFEPYDKFNAISSFSPAAYDPSRPASDPCNGLVVPKGSNPCAGIPGASTPVQFSNRSLRYNNFKNIAPRLGVSWDVFKNGKTALRAGFGQFFLRERVSPVVAALTSNPPFVRSVSAERTLDGTVYNDLLGGTGIPSRSFDPTAKTPYSYQFNVSLDQEIFRGAVLEIGYVGNRARNQLTHFDINQVLPQNRVAAAFAPNAAAVNALRPYPHDAAIFQFARDGYANYDSLQVLFRTRFLKTSQFQAAYTFSKSLANFGLNDSSGGPTSFALNDVTNPRYDYGPSDINRPHIFVANLILHFPSFKGYNSLARTLIGGWETSSIIQISSGTSFTPYLNATGITDFNAVPQSDGTIAAFAGGITGTGTSVANQRPNRVAGVPCTISGNGDGTVFVNPNAFSLVGMKIGQPGDSSRGQCSGPPTKNVDVSLYKNFSPKWLTNSFFGEAARIQFRLEAFNVFNTPQFTGDLNSTFYDGYIVCGNAPCSPTNNLVTGMVRRSLTNPNVLIPAGPNPNFGIAGQTRGGREIQYALKFTF